MASITNQIIANLKKTSTSFGSVNYVNSDNVICFDTCNNRIGINKKQLSYSIDISGSSNNHAINVHNGLFNTISSNIINTISC